MTSGIQFEILGWAKFNPRVDIKNPSWFRFSHSFLEDPDFFDFSHSEIVAWIYLLSMASKKNGGRITLNFAHAHHCARLSKSAIESALKKLQQLNVLRVHVTDTLRERNADVTGCPATNETNERTYMLTSFAEIIEGIYSGYPRKIGKKRGTEILLRQLLKKQLGAGADEMRQALAHFKAHHAREKTEPKFIPHFSTWANNWFDWLDPQTGTSSSKLAVQLKTIDEVLG